MFERLNAGSLAVEDMKRLMIAMKEVTFCTVFTVRVLPLSVNHSQSYYSYELFYL